MKRLCIVGVEEIMDNSALRWLGHVERKGDLDWVSNCRRIEVEGEVCRGRRLNTWGGRIDQLMKKNGLRLDMAVIGIRGEMEVLRVVPRG